MFQTEIIIGIQSLASDSWTGFFKFWTTLGYPVWIAALLLVFLFGVRFRQGFILLQALLWNGLIIGVLKEIFALPRPWFVDTHVSNWGGNAAPATPFVDMGSDSFLGRLPREVIEAFRARPLDSWGFPSGHTSSSVALWGTAALMFRKKALTVLATAMMIFIPLSRIYLGRHFLADILAGYILGFLVLLIFYYGAYTQDWWGVFAHNLDRIPRGRLPAILLISYNVVLPWLLLLVPQVHPGGAGTLLGLNLGFLCLRGKGLPEDSAPVIQRAGRVITALLLFLGLFLFLRALCGWLFHPEPAMVYFLRMAVVAFLVLWGATRLSLRLGWYQGGPLAVPIP